MTESLPRRAGSTLWLPVLGDLVVDERLVYKRGAVGPRGVARLRVWDAVGGGHFAVVTDLGRGMSVTDARPGLRRMLQVRFGEPFAMAEQWPGSHVDLVLRPVDGEQATVRLWPDNPDSLLHGYVSAWWKTCGEAIQLLT